MTKPGTACERILRVSTPKITVCVTVNAGNIIVETAPIARRFLGQPLANLQRWLTRSCGGLIVKEITPATGTKGDLWTTRVATDIS